MNVVVTSIDSSTGAMRVTWEAPDSNGSNISRYTIYVGNEAGSTYTESSDCDGSDSGVKSALSCTVEMATLKAAPYSYTTLGATVLVRATATNAYGEST